MHLHARKARVTQVLVVLVALLPAGRAGGTEPTLERAESAFAALDYVQAIEIADAVLARGRNGPDAVRRAYALLGQANAVTGQDQQAKRSFRMLLALQPDFRLPPTTSPKVRKPLTEVLADWAGRPGLSVGHRTPQAAPHDQPLRLQVLVVEDPLTMVAAAAVSWKLPGGSSWSTLRAEGRKRDYTLLVPLPVEGARPGTLSYYVELLDENNNVLLRKGDPGSPLEVRLTGAAAPGPAAPGPSPPASTPWYKRWWVWTIAGVLVAGATTAAVVVTTRPDSTQIELGWEVKGAQQ